MGSLQGCETVRYKSSVPWWMRKQCGHNDTQPNTSQSCMDASIECVSSYDTAASSLHSSTTCASLASTHLANLLRACVPRHLGHRSHWNPQRFYMQRVLYV